MQKVDEMGKKTKIVFFGGECEENPLEDLIGIVKLKVDVERILKEKGIEDAGKHLGF